MLEPLEPRTLLAAGLLISEFMASNHQTLADEDGQYSDWIEVHNPTAAAVDLAGWHLTDKPDQLTEWDFPAVTLEAGGYLVVFASGKDRRDFGRPLHANFQLDGDGEYLALVEPDGTTIASAFSPQFPRQKDDVSYGVGQEITDLVPAGAPAATLVPSNGSLGGAWTTEGFGDSSWTRGPTGIGFEVGGGQTSVIAYGDNAGNVGGQEFGGSLGHDFYVHRPITVTQLGVFDSGSNGLSRTLTAEIWTRNGNTGTRLTRLTFTPADPGTLLDGDRFKPLATPLVLSPGDYTVVAYGYGTGEPNGNFSTPPASQKTTNSGSGAIEFVGVARYSFTPGAFPETPDGGPVNRYSAGTFQFLVPAYTDLIRTDLKTAMYGTNASIYSRIVFSGADPSAFSSLSLQVKYDDGFVAYLNGTEVSRRNAPAAVQWNSTAPGPRPVEQSLAFESINITDHAGAIHPGTNVLAIQGLNASAADNDFLVLPQLIAAGTPGAEQRYFDAPTPGAPNNSNSSFAGFVDDVQTSVDRGFFQSPMDVAMTTATSGAQIYYTLDGTEPAPTHGTLYQAPVRVTATTTLRAAAFKTDFLPSRVNTQTYLFLGSVVARTGAPAGYPAVWNGGYTADYGMSQNAADLPLIAGNPSYTAAQARQAIQDSLRSLPTLSIVLPPESLFDPATGIYVNPTGRDTDNWEKAASIEYLLPDGSPGFQINGGLQIEGYSSRNLGVSPKLSMRLVFKRQYGDASLDYPFFPDSPVDHYDTLVLRSNARDSWLSSDEGSCPRSHALYIRDEWAKQAQGDMGEAATSGTFVHLYINGMYWGVYNPTERPDADFAAEHLGGSPDDYDVVKFCYPRAVDGDLAEWTRLLDLAAAGLGSDAQYQYIQGNHPDGTRNPSYDVLIDIDNFIDFVINGQYHASGDWPGNYYVIRERGPESKGFQFFTWDNDLAFPYESINRDKTRSENNVLWDLSPGRIDIALRANAEYRLRFADHVQEQFFNGGSLTPQAAANRWTRIVNQVKQAMIAESARWGDYRRDVAPSGSERVLYTPSQWKSVSATMLSSYFPNRGNVVLSQLRSVGLYSGLTAPSLNQHGGSVPAGFALALSAPAGAIYYTLDGSDPRLAGGAIHGVRYTGPVVLTNSARVKARVWDGSQWSALEEADFTVVGTSHLITELNYNPAQPTSAEQDLGYTDNDSFEFIELTNSGTNQAIDLSGVRFTAGVSFDFAAGSITSLAPSSRLLIVRNRAAFEARYGPGLPIAGEYLGSLDNNGEQVTLTDSAGMAIADFAYGDNGAWPGRADGQGSTLEAVSVGGDYDDPANWRASTEFGGSPGHSGMGPETDVVINEVIAHSDRPLVDAIELYNTTDNPVNLGGWWLSDSSADYEKFRIPANTWIAAHGYLVFPEGHWVDDQLQFDTNEFGGGAKGFGLDGAHGDDVYLLATDGEGRLAYFVDHVDFGAMASGESLGRWPDDQGNWHMAPMLRRTLDAPNHANASGGSGPRVGPLVISEVVYAPRALSANETGAGFSDAEDLEFIEIYNPTTATVNLSNWRLDKAVTYDFAAGASLAAGGTLLVVPFDPANGSLLAAFRARYFLGTSAAVVGPYSGHLDNLNDHLELLRPDSPPIDEPDFHPGLMEDEIRYVSAWGGNGDGKALRRVAADAWGADRSSWGAVALSASLPPAAHLVAERHLFYNNSAFDGRNIAANAQDDGAIATDKQPLLPGRVSTFDNYTSFSRGINGIMLDVAGLGTGMTAADFAFRVGNDGLPAGWTAVPPAPTTVTTRALTNGLTRVTILWPDNAIQGQWLEVQVLANAHTNLPGPDLFYFGNAVGETGDRRASPATDAEVDQADEAAVRANNMAMPASIGNRYDFNRDRRVNALDELLARNNYRQGASALELIDLSRAGLAQAGAGEVAEGQAASAAADAAISANSPFGKDSLVATKSIPAGMTGIPPGGPGPTAQVAVNGERSIPPSASSGRAVRRAAPSARAAAHDTVLMAVLQDWDWLWEAQQQALQARPAKNRGVFGALPAGKAFQG